MDLSIIVIIIIIVILILTILFIILFNKIKLFGGDDINVALWELTFTNITDNNGKYIIDVNLVVEKIPEDIYNNNYNSDSYVLDKDNSKMYLYPYSIDDRTNKSEEDKHMYKPREEILKEKKEFYLKKVYGEDYKVADLNEYGDIDKAYPFSVVKSTKGEFIFPPESLNYNTGCRLNVPNEKLYQYIREKYGKTANVVFRIHAFNKISIMTKLQDTTRSTHGVDPIIVNHEQLNYFKQASNNIKFEYEYVFIYADDGAIISFGETIPSRINDCRNTPDSNYEFFNITLVETTKYGYKSARMKDFNQNMFNKTNNEVILPAIGEYSKKFSIGPLNVIDCARCTRCTVRDLPYSILGTIDYKCKGEFRKFKKAWN